MKNMRKFNGKRVLSTLLCLMLTVTMIVGARLLPRPREAAMVQSISAENA